MSLAAQLGDGHGWLGYAVVVVLAASVALAWRRRTAGEPYTEGLPRLAGLLLALQFVYGLLVYVQARAWEAPALLAYVHPVAMLGGVALSGVATARAARADAAPFAWAAIGRFQGAALLLVLIGVGAASAA